ncbi:MAG: HTH-type transcriptional repressor ComR [Cyanobacteriota bacterium]|jgi:TetR/AcrR family transcriptional regulator, transcriptional repressor for nem operon
MPRNKEFDPEICLDKLMYLFWQKGYLDTSIADLVEYSGVQRYGLYETFGGKQEIFQRVLERYQDTVVSQRLVMLEKRNSSPSLSEIKQFFEQFIQLLDDPSGSSGCLMCNTAVELGCHSEEVTAKILQYFDRFRQGFARSLERAKQNGEISKHTDIEQMVEFLVGSLVGMTAYARSPVPKIHVHNYIKGIIAILHNL